MLERFEKVNKVGLFENYMLLPKLRDLDAINDAALPSHHATDDVPGLQPLTPDAVRIFAQKALAVLG